MGDFNASGTYITRPYSPIMSRMSENFKPVRPLFGNSRRISGLPGTHDIPIAPFSCGEPGIVRQHATLCCSLRFATFQQDLGTTLLAFPLRVATLDASPAALLACPAQIATDLPDRRVRCGRFHDSSVSPLRCRSAASVPRGPK